VIPRSGGAAAYTACDVRDDEAVEGRQRQMSEEHFVEDQRARQPRRRKFHGRSVRSRSQATRSPRRFRRCRRRADQLRGRQVLDVVTRARPIGCGISVSIGSSWCSWWPRPRRLSSESLCGSGHETRPRVQIQRLSATDDLVTEVTRGAWRASDRPDDDRAAPRPVLVSAIDRHDSARALLTATANKRAAAWALLARRHRIASSANDPIPRHPARRGRCRRDNSESRQTIIRNPEELIDSDRAQIANNRMTMAVPPRWRVR